MTKYHQNDTLSLLDVRHLFDTVLEDYCEASGRLSQKVEIVYESVFESSVVKVLENRDLSESELRAVAGPRCGLEE